MTTMVFTPKQAVIEALSRKRRVPELEAIILRDPVASCFYAKNVVKGRWPEAESVIAIGLNRKFSDFNILDEDTRETMGYGYKIGPRPQGTDHVNEGNELRVLVVYMRLAGCRVPAFESKLMADNWKGPGYDYCKMVYRATGEIIDIESPTICSWMIRDLCHGKVSKKIDRAERIRVCKELHARMILHSFSHGDDSEVKNYFSAYKKSENHFLVMLSQMDENMTIGDAIRSMIGSK